MTYLSEFNKAIKEAKNAKALTTKTHNIAGYEIVIKTFLTHDYKKTSLGTITVDGYFSTQAKIKNLMREAA